MDKTLAVFQTSSTLYNQSDIIYNSSSQIYAGYDLRQKIGEVPTFDDYKPEIISIGEI
jgi:hypothetical protein